MKTINLKLILPLVLLILSVNSYSQKPDDLNPGYSIDSRLQKITGGRINTYADSLQKKLIPKRSISALFLGFGGGLAIPMSKFSETANPTFGILGRLEFSSTGIFPFVIGGEVNYFSYNSPDEFRTINLLSSYRTKILSFGLNIDYSLSKLFRTSFTMPFISVDVKSNNIKRDFDENRSFEGVPLTESKVSVGAGLGFTLFILDFSVKYNYMKDNSFISVTTKTKFPVIRF
ncbi:MAG TPA: hypothetical protein PKE39_09405 [Ignavibacteria bacterium]|nr:hypothetical protein [Ignavibacteria bacterium]